jgi:hypothetical protein
MLEACIGVVALGRSEKLLIVKEPHIVEVVR